MSRKVMAAIPARPVVLPLLSDEHFAGDGTLVKAWASMKSFQPKDGAPPPHDDGPGGPPPADEASADTQQQPKQTETGGRCGTHSLRRTKAAQIYRRRAICEICSFCSATRKSTVPFVISALSYPFHPPGAPERLRTNHLAKLETPILSRKDDLVGTADTARRLAARIPDARLRIWPEGGHILLGHDTDVARESARFVSGVRYQGETNR